MEEKDGRVGLGEMRNQLETLVFLFLEPIILEGIRCPVIILAFASFVTLSFK